MISLLLVVQSIASCSLFIDDGLDGLGPYPADAGPNDRDTTQIDVDTRDQNQRGPADAATDERVIPPDAPSDLTAPDRVDGGTVDASERIDVSVDTKGGTSDSPDAAPLDIISERDEPVVADVTVDQNDPADGREDAVDGRVDAVDGPVDAPIPGDGGIVGVGSWVVSGAVTRVPGKLEIWGVMMPTTAIRTTTRSGLTIEGWLQ
jgi:hypothetical protein